MPILSKLFKAIRASFTMVETGLLALFFVQALRYSIGGIYSTVSAAVVQFTQTSALTDDLNTLLPMLGASLALPLLTLLIGGIRWSFALFALLIALFRLLMVAPDTSTPLLPSLVVVAGGFSYIVLIVRQRATLLPVFFIVGFALDQVWRAYGNTLDISLSRDYFPIQVALSTLVVLLSVINVAKPIPIARDLSVNHPYGALSFTSALALGASCFLQLSLFALPNAVAGRTSGDYTLLAPALIAATLAPLLPFVRTQARQLIAPFDSSTRGWIWLVFLALLVIIGTRLSQLTLGNVVLPIGAVTLVIAQTGISLLWWWLVRPQGEREFNLSGLWIVTSILLLGLFVVLDLFTYEYAFVASTGDSAGEVFATLLRGMRGMGLGVILLALFIAAMPMVQSTRRIPWLGASWQHNAAVLFVVLAMSGAGAFFARPVLVMPALNLTEMRVGTYNINSGYSATYTYDLNSIALSILESGVQVVLLQEVDAGRLTSFGVDQSLWLARFLGMDRRFFATNEGLLGLAVLSRVPIVYHDGTLLPSADQQTGVQRVQIQPDEGVITLYNTALGLLLQGESVAQQEANQRIQLNALLALIEQHVQNDYGGILGRTVLGGTFNNVPNAPLFQSLKATRFVDPFEGASLDLSATYVSPYAGRARVDYLWVWSDILRSTGNGVIPSDASDHRLAFVSLEIRR